VEERRAELTGQQLLELGAVNQHESRSPRLRHHLPRDAQQPRAIRPLNPLPGQLHRQLRHLASQPDRRQRRQRVRPQAHPRPDLLQHWRLLKDLSGQALAGQGNGSGKPADPAADNRDFRSHAGILPD
jgi:hypothetical protein